MRQVANNITKIRANERRKKLTENNISSKISLQTEANSFLIKFCDKTEILK